MTIIKIVLLFTKKNRLTENQRERIEQLVREVYCREFSCAESELDISLCNGDTETGADYDVVLAISADKKILNEGVHRDNLRKAVGKRLWTFLPKNLGFGGRVGTFDGLPEESTKIESAETPNVANYVAENPRMSFDMLQLPSETLRKIERAIARIKLERKIFDEWGLYAIMPNPVCALSFYGLPGTGKTLAADAVASDLGKKIIRASYADIESKYHGEGPKNVNAIFTAAEKQDALLFIDEADSLLSKRLTNVTQGSEQAINSMRSQILICLERFRGVVIFATNLVVNYDKAFESRLISVEFTLPDAEMREKIWRAHLYPNPKAEVQLKIPLSDDINLGELAKYPLCGRDIRNIVINACVGACMENSPVLTRKHLVDATVEEIANQKKLSAAKDHTDREINLSAEVKEAATGIITEKVAEINGRA